MLPKSEKGQTLLIVILIMVIALTVGLAVVSRSVTNLRTSTEEENSQRAFSAAEAGVEQAIKKDYLESGSLTIEKTNLGNDSSFKTDISAISGNEFVLNGGGPIEADDGVDIWLSDYQPIQYANPITTNYFNIYWGLPTENNCTDQMPAAIEAIVLTGTKDSPVAKRYLFDPCAGTRGNNFSSAVDVNPPAVGGRTFRYRAQVGSITSGLIARIIPLYKRTSLGVNTCDPATGNCSGATSLPSQGNRIDSTGTYKSTDRKITYYQGYPSLPSEFFQYAVFSAE